MTQTQTLNTNTNRRQHPPNTQQLLNQPPTLPLGWRLCALSQFWFSTRVGVLMMGEACKIKWDQMNATLPAFLTIILMQLNTALQMMA